MKKAQLSFVEDVVLDCLTKKMQVKWVVCIDPKIDTRILAQECGYEKRTVEKCLTRLESKGYISLEYCINSSQEEFKKDSICQRVALDIHVIITHKGITEMKNKEGNSQD